MLRWVRFVAVAAVLFIVGVAGAAAAGASGITPDPNFPPTYGWICSAKGSGCSQAEQSGTMVDLTTGAALGNGLPVYPGDVLQYTYTARNDSSTALSGLAVTTTDGPVPCDGPCQFAPDAYIGAPYGGPVKDTVRVNGQIVNLNNAWPVQPDWGWDGLSSWGNVGFSALVGHAPPDSPNPCDCATGYWAPGQSTTFTYQFRLPNNVKTGIKWLGQGGFNTDVSPPGHGWTALVTSEAFIDAPTVPRVLLTNPPASHAGDPADTTPIIVGDEPITGSGGAPGDTIVVSGEFEPQSDTHPQVELCRAVVAADHSWACVPTVHPPIPADDYVVVTARDETTPDAGSVQGWIEMPAIAPVPLVTAWIAAAELPLLAVMAFVARRRVRRAAR